MVKTLPSKALFTLNIGNYEPEITALTYPYLKKYAEKIGAEFIEITERKFPDRHPIYERFQLYELSRNYDWNIFFDADALVHPDLFDVTEVVGKDTVLQKGKDFLTNRFKMDDYMRRDGRHIGSGTWFVVWSNWCRDLWHPLEEGEDVTPYIHPVNIEASAGITCEHLDPDYVVSRNIARYGLKFKTFKDLGLEEDYFCHHYLIPPKQKIQEIREHIAKWRLLRC